MAFTDCTLKVGIAPLRAALLSVVAHADRAKLGDEDLAMARVRFIASKDELLVAAMSSTTAGTTSAMAAVTIDADDRTVKFDVADGPLVLDLHPAKTRDLARTLKPVKGDDGMLSGWANVTLDVEACEVTVVDESGLWPGTRLTVPALDVRPDFPDVPGIIARAATAAAGTYKPFVPGHGLTARFLSAEKHWDSELEARPTGTAESSGWVVTCGDAFIGTVEGFHGSGNSLKARDARWMKHLKRLGAGAQLKAV